MMEFKLIHIVAIIATFLIAAVVFFLLGIVYRKKVSEKEISSAEEEARRIINEAIKSAEGKKREALLEAKEEILKARNEFEKEITFDEALSLLRLCEPGVINKVRWLVPVGNHTFEVDEFFDDNEGLVMAEVELKEENETFERPDFLGEEVTGDRRYYNSCLRLHPFKEWSCEAQTPS